MAVEMKILNSHEGWLVARRNYVGGSDASAVLGMNPYKTNIELWEEKTGLLVPEDISDNYTAGVSDGARYTACGNGWTVDVIAYILNGLKGAK